MAVKKCPKCGGTHCQQTESRSKHGFIKFIFFGLPYLFWLLIKVFAAFFVFIFIDWWMAIIKAIKHQGYSWRAKRLLTIRKKSYYCQDCGNNFRA